jgi:adenosylcobyric acid synthase
MRARAIMVLGTSSHAGKSMLVAALCRIFAKHGVRVAPFKSQNMSLNSAATVEGLEIGRAQALQAEAAGIPASVNMNPILIKPCGDRTSQVVVNGKIWCTLSASDYHLRRVEELMPVIRASYEALATEYEVIVLEGAGSPAEINLKQHDVVNMRMAELAQARCMLLGDIDRGGVFASLLGTVSLLEPGEQARIDAFVINKFRGDLSLLESGINMMEERLQKSCLGVIPYLDELTLDEEDSLGLPPTGTVRWLLDDSPERPLRIAVVALPSFSNFTDFDALQSEPSVSLQFCRTPVHLRHADLIILPGSKQTADDLAWLRASGLDHLLVDHAQTGLMVGICGGMQMLGERIDDAHGMESAGVAVGLGLLPIRTTMQAQKVTSLARGVLATSSIFCQHVKQVELSGYEIHIGETTYLEGAQVFAHVACASTPDAQYRDGCSAASGRIIGTYLHGIFDHDDFRHVALAAARAFHRLAPRTDFQNWKAKREASLNRLADEVETALDMPSIFAMVGCTYSPTRLTGQEPNSNVGG